MAVGVPSVSKRGVGRLLLREGEIEDEIVAVVGRSIIRVKPASTSFTLIGSSSRYLVNMNSLSGQSFFLIRHTWWIRKSCLLVASPMDQNMLWISCCSSFDIWLQFLWQVGLHLPLTYLAISFVLSNLPRLVFSAFYISFPASFFSHEHLQ